MQQQEPIFMLLSPFILRLFERFREDAEPLNARIKCIVDNIKNTSDCKIDVFLNFILCIFGSFLNFSSHT